MAFREAMALVASSVHVVTTVADGNDAGITATAVCAVSDTPPSLLVCLNRRSYAHSMIARSRVLAVNTLSYDQLALAPEFAGQGSGPMPARFARATWSRGSTGAPLLMGCLTSFDCRVSHSTVMGTHEMFVCTVIDIVRTPDRWGLGYAGRRYFSVDLAPAAEAPLISRIAGNCGADVASRPCGLPQEDDGSHRREG
ncbi:FMN reductase [Nonomuraea sp. FMUSA5-5]|uniref:FMN reductase n=1 Tax=Nonomuraea composti TaxID=2720023 RepID=A0ABX1BH63_9ACTN|nr:flavin reductase family protein [Nonomuraea sp. FMUSA5-5]NJP97088.1 FMN reductase [Nonomuraea sp. FMUSA5-5]